jgi:hypothetical protein
MKFFSPNSLPEKSQPLDLPDPPLWSTKSTDTAFPEVSNFM